jgi:hypothetical protein
MLTRDVYTHTIILTPNSNTIGIPFFSAYRHLNAYSKVCFTIILVDIASFNNQLIYYPPVQPANQYTSNFGIPSQFNPHQSQKCIIGVDWMWMVNSASPFYFGITDTGTFPNSSLSTISYNMNGV